MIDGGKFRVSIERLGERLIERLICPDGASACIGWRPIGQDNARALPLRYGVDANLAVSGLRPRAARTVVAIPFQAVNCPACLIDVPCGKKETAGSGWQPSRSATGGQLRIPEV